MREGGGREGGEGGKETGGMGGGIGGVERNGGREGGREGGKEREGGREGMREGGWREGAEGRQWSHTHTHLSAAHHKWPVILGYARLLRLHPLPSPHLRV